MPLRMNNYSEAWLYSRRALLNIVRYRLPIYKMFQNKKAANSRFCRTLVNIISKRSYL